MEVSAHALYLRKLVGVVFEAAAYTNLSQDHLDFFGTMDNYLAAKKLLFSRRHGAQRRRQRGRGDGEGRLRQPPRC